MILSDVRYVRVLLTSKCNMSCLFCHKEGSCSINAELDPELLLNTLNYLYGIGYRKIKLMGGEPLLYSDIKDIIYKIKTMGDDIDLSMISNGCFDSSRYIKLFEKGLDRLNISIHGWEYPYFHENTGGALVDYNRIKSTLYDLVSINKINKINYVLKKGVNENDFVSMINDIQGNYVIVDVLNLLVYQGQESNLKFQYSFEEIEDLISQNWNVKSNEIVINKYSLPSKRIILENGININLKVTELNKQNVFFSCGSCIFKDRCIEGIKAIRITSDGMLQPCLLRNDNTLDLNCITDFDDIKEFLERL